MEPLLLIGGGGHCKACIDVIERQEKYQIAGIIDLPGQQGETLLDYPVVGTDDDLPQLLGSTAAAILIYVATAQLHPIPFITMVAIGLPPYFLFLAIVRLLLHPPAPARLFLNLPETLAHRSSHHRISGRWPGRSPD